MTLEAENFPEKSLCFLRDHKASYLSFYEPLNDGVCFKVENIFSKYHIFYSVYVTEFGVLLL